MEKTAESLGSIEMQALMIHDLTRVINFRTGYVGYILMDGGPSGNTLFKPVRQKIEPVSTFVKPVKH